MPLPPAPPFSRCPSPARPHLHSHSKHGDGCTPAGPANFRFQFPSLRTTGDGRTTAIERVRASRAPSLPPDSASLPSHAFPVGAPPFHAQPDPERDAADPEQSVWKVKGDAEDCISLRTLSCGNGWACGLLLRFPAHPSLWQVPVLVPRSHTWARPRRWELQPEGGVGGGGLSQQLPDPGPQPDCILSAPVPRAKAAC